ncbi:quinone oxidoreductase family protein [Hymenobacter terricola]|uniref:quinone oxidoreductase family protein n=1 Tax=Hymenobacter terricola TaxID=2819236 RepID=UPI001B30D130|nr:quinone oxidoreductase [Hymenobacter terricola]
MTTAMHALGFHRFGGPEVLEYLTVPVPPLRPGHVLLRPEAIGLNFADVYRRRGHYHLAGEPPYVLGYEAAGTIAAVAPDVTGFRVGQRVAVADVPHANAEWVLAPATHLIAVPDAVSSPQAAAVLLQGLTAQYLATDSYPVGPGTLAVVHAAAGGVGQLLTQYVKLRGGTVVGLTSTADKAAVAWAAVAWAAGADAVLHYADDWVAAVRAWRPGDRAGADVVYDSVGSTLPQSLQAARRGGGAVVFYGMAGGNPAPVDPRHLMDESKTLTGGDLWRYLTTPEERRRRAARLFALLTSGQLRVNISRTFALHDGAAAHRYLESRQSTGKILLLP